MQDLMTTTHTRFQLQNLHVSVHIRTVYNSKKGFSWFIFLFFLMSITSELSEYFKSTIADLR